MPNVSYNSKDSLHPIAFDFINVCKNANVILNADESNAIDFLVRGLLQSKLWDKFKAIYPMVGRSAISHALNLKNTNRHKILWFNINDLIHDKDGVRNTGIGYGNTMVAPSWFSDDDIHVAIYHTNTWADLNIPCIAIGSRSLGNYRGWMHTIMLKSLLPVLRPDSSFYAQPPYFTYSCGLIELNAPGSSDLPRFAGNDASFFTHAEATGLIVGVNGIKCYVNGEIFGRQGSLTDKLPDRINTPIIRTLKIGKYETTTTIPNLSQFPFMLFTNTTFGQGNSTFGQGRFSIKFASIGNALNDYENKEFYKIVQEFQRILKRHIDPIKLQTSQLSNADSIITELKITNIRTRRFKPYVINTDDGLNPAIKINKIESIGPFRMFVNDRASASVSIQSFIEI